MVRKTYYRIVINGQPQRLYINSSTKEFCTVPAGTGLNGPNEFSCTAIAEKQAVRWGLTGYDIRPAERDIGTPTRLTEIGF